MSEQTRQPVTGLRRWLAVGFGLFFVGLAGLGAVLPILPTTPFLLLASYFFSCSSPAWRAWLFRLPVWGTLLRDWQTHRTVRLHAKLAAFITIPLAILSSALLTNFAWPWLLLLALLGSIGLWTVWRLPVATLPMVATQQCAGTEKT